MIEVQMTDDIRKYETKTLGPFTTRQVICFIIAAVITIPIAALTDFEWDNKMLLVLVLSVPIVACGYVKMDGAYFEILALRLIYFFFLTPKKRKYVRKNTYKKLQEAVEKSEKKAKLGKLTESQRKAYQKHEEAKKKKVNIKYSNKKELKIYT